jgi:hypothetical protein
MEEDQIVGNNGVSLTMMGLHDVLRNIEQMLAPFKYYIEASEVGMALVPSMAQVLQVPPMVQAPQALPVVQATYTREPKFIMPDKFDGTRSKFRDFVQ